MGIFGLIVTGTSRRRQREGGKVGGTTGIAISD
jgi:hypothetical protein